ncbi:MAG: MFS transporter [Gemmatimonadales bacterium]
MATEARAPARTPLYAGYALGLLTLVNVLNYLDRNVIFALFGQIKADLGLTDAQLGWLGSARILIFSLAALPFGMLGDLRSRRAVISAGTAVRSAFTAIGGLVTTFPQFFLCRSTVGIGEAACNAPSQSLVADYYPKGRALAMGILAAGIAVGGVLGIWLGGQLGELYGWRVTFMTVGLPGFALAALVARLRDPTREPKAVSLRSSLEEFGLGLTSLGRMFAPSLVGLAIGAVAFLVLDGRYQANSQVDVGAFAAALGLGVAWNIWIWVQKIRACLPEETPLPAMEDMGGAVMELWGAIQSVLNTPTLVYIFIGGALISFGINGMVGWAPTFLNRALGLSTTAGAVLLGKWGLIFGTAGTLFGGWMADVLRRTIPTGRVITGVAGIVIGAPLAIWLVTLRDPAIFVPVFSAAFFFLTWYNGPMAAVIFDVAPPRISATVIGAYVMFIHVAGDAVAFPLVGMLSDRFGIERAILVLPMVALGGGLVVLGALRTLVVDMERAAV